MLCPNCNNIIDDDSRFCKSCGVEFLGKEKDLIPDSFSMDLSFANEPEVPVVTPAPKKKQYNKNVIILIVASILVVISLFSLVFVLIKTDVIGGGKETITDADGEEIKAGRGKTEITVLDVDGTKRVIKTDRQLLTNDKILAEYTSVMNKIKTDAPAFTYKRYQNLPVEHQNAGSVAKFVLPIIEKYVISESAKDEVKYLAGNAQELPLPDSAYGCILTDSSAIKNAYCEVLDDETYKIVITLNDELNPPELTAGATTSTSITNSVFDNYDVLNQITSISEVSFNKIDFNYTDCTVTLIYNPDNQEVQSINMVMNIDITANILILGEIKARIVDTVEYTNIDY